MRCQCCNRNLSDYESTLRHAITNQFVDMCNKCLKEVDIPVRGRPDLNKFETMEEDEMRFEHDDE